MSQTTTRAMRQAKAAAEVAAAGLADFETFEGGPEEFVVVLRARTLRDVVPAQIGVERVEAAFGVDVVILF